MEITPVENSRSKDRDYFMMRKLEITENINGWVTNPLYNSEVPSMENSTSSSDLPDKCSTMPQNSCSNDLDSATPVVSSQVLAVKAVQTGPPLPVIKVSFIVEGRYICDTEIDTDASHTMISPSVFRKAQYVAKNKPIQNRP